MSNNCYYEYYNYLQYIKNAKVPPIYLNENGYIFSTAPIDVSNNIISLRVASPLIVDKYSLTLDTSANYNFSSSKFTIESSGIFMPHLPLASTSGDIYTVVVDGSGRLSYNIFSATGISYVVGGTNINVQHGNTIPIVNLAVTSPVDLNNQPLLDSSYIDFGTNIDIRNAGLSQIYSNLTNSGEIWINTHGLGNDTIHLNTSVVDFSGASLLHINDISSQSINTQSITTQSLNTQSISLQNLYASGTISGDTIYSNTAVYTPLISSSSGQLTLQSGNVSNSITIDNAGTVNINGSTINMGNATSVINMMGTVNKIETTNVEIYDQLITLNKNGSSATSYGSGFEIEASGSIVGYIKTDMITGKSFIVKVPNSSTVYTMMLKDSNGNIDMSGNLSINQNKWVINSQNGDMHVGGAFDVSGNTVLSGNASVAGNATIDGATNITGSTHVGGAFDVSGNTILSGNASVSGAANISGATNIVGSTHVGGAFDVSGNTVLSGNASIAGDTNVAGSTNIVGSTHVGGAFDVSGNTILSGNANIAGAASIVGSTHVGGVFDVSGATILNGQLTLNSLSNVKKTLLLNIDPVSDIVSFESKPTYSQPLSIDVNNLVSMTQSSATTNGYLVSGDWVKFNTMLSNISANAPLTYINNVINISNVDLNGTNGYLSSAQYQAINSSITAAAGTAIAQIYYVAMNGNDLSGNGSVTNPYATIQKAINQCTDASKYYTIYISPYAYTESPTIGASISPRISIIGLTNNTNSKNVTITGSFTIAATTATGNETNNVIAFKNLTIQSSSGPAINLTGQGFSMFVNNCNLALTGSNASSLLNLASTSSLTRYYFDNVRMNNVAVASSNHMVNLVAGKIWSITNSDFTNANTGGSVIYSYDNSGQLLTVANSSFTNSIYGNVFTIQANPSSCSLSNTTLIGYNTDALAGLLVLGNGVAAGSGGAFSIINCILYNTNSATSANTYVLLNGGATLISSSNTFYSTNTGATTFNPFGYKATKTNNIVRYTNSAYISGNVAGTNTVNYPSVSAGIIVIENVLNDTDNLTNFNNAAIKFNAIPETTTDLSMVTYNTTTKQISYKTIPVASAGSNIGISYTNNNPTISVAISSTLDMSNQGIIGISYERFAGEINIQNKNQSPIIYTTGNTANLLLNPSGGVINTTGHNIDLSNASLVGISSEIFANNVNIQSGIAQVPIIYTTGTSTNLLLNPSGGVINTTGHNIDMSNASIVGIASEVFTTNISLEANGAPVIYTTGTATDIVLHPTVVGGVVKINNGHTLDMTGGSIINAGDIISKSSTDLALIGGNGGSHILLKTGNTPITRMEMDNVKISMYLPLDMQNNYITNTSYLNFATGSGNGNINIQQNGVPRIITSGQDLIIDPSTNGSLQFGGAHTFDICGGRITNASSITGFVDSSLTIQYLNGGGSIYLKSGSFPTNKKMVLDNSGIHVSGTGVFDISGITSNVVIDASGNLNMGSNIGNAYKFKVEGSTGNMYVGGTTDISGITTIALNGNKFVVDTTGTHSSGGVLDASGVLYKNTLSDTSGNVFINGVAQFANEVDICSNIIKLNLPDGSSNAYYVSYDLAAKKVGYKNNVSASSPLLLDGNNNLSYDYTSYFNSLNINSSSPVTSAKLNINNINNPKSYPPTYSPTDVSNALQINNGVGQSMYMGIDGNNQWGYIQTTTGVGLVLNPNGFTTSAGNSVFCPYFNPDNIQINNGSTLIKNAFANFQGKTTFVGADVSYARVSINAIGTENNYSTSAWNTANALQITTGTSGASDYTMFMGVDKSNGVSYIKSSNMAGTATDLHINSNLVVGSARTLYMNPIYMNNNLLYLNTSGGTSFSMGTFFTGNIKAYFGNGTASGNANFNCDGLGNTAVAGAGSFYITSTNGTQASNGFTLNSGNMGIGTTIDSNSKMKIDFSGIAVGQNVLSIHTTNPLTDNYNLIEAGHGGTYFQVRGTSEVAIGGITGLGSRLSVYDSTTNNVVIGKFLSNASNTGESFTFIDIEKGSGYGGRIGGFLKQESGSGLRFTAINGGAESVYFRLQSYNDLSYTGFYQFSALGTGTVYSNTGWISNSSPSDPTIKKNIISLNDNSNNICNTVLQLNPISYEWINPSMGTGTKYGFSARQIHDLIPDIASTYTDTSGNIRYSGYDPVSLIPFLTSALQTKSKKMDELENKIMEDNQIHNQVHTQQQQQISQQQSVITTLSSQIDALTSQNTSLTTQVSTLTSQVASLMSDMAKLKQMFNL
jgi:hypothetical protein